MINNDYRTPPELVSALEGACRSYGAPVGGQSEWCLRDFLDLSRYTTDGDDRDPYYGMIQPRVGFAWDVRGNSRTVVFGGWGRYFDRVVLNDIFDEQYRQQYKIYSFCFSADGRPAPNCSVPALAWRDEYLSAAALRQLIASGQAPGPEIFLVDNEMRPPRSDQWTLGVRQQFGSWLTSLSYAGVRGYNNLMYFFGDLPPGTPFGERFGNNVQVPGYARVFVTSTSRRTWYDGLFLNLDRPLTAGGNWGFNLAYTYAEAEQTGTDNPGEGVAFGAFDYLSPESLYRFPGTNDERHRLVMSGTVALPANFQVSSIITLGSGVPFTLFDDSHGALHGALERGPAGEEGLHHPGRLGVPQRGPAPRMAGSDDRQHGGRQPDRRGFQRLQFRQRRLLRKLRPAPAGDQRAAAGSPTASSTPGASRPACGWVSREDDRRGTGARAASAPFRDGLRAVRSPCIDSCHGHLGAGRRSPGADVPLLLGSRRPRKRPHPGPLAHAVVLERRGGGVRPHRLSGRRGAGMGDARRGPPPCAHHAALPGAGAAGTRAYRARPDIKVSSITSST